MMEFRKRIVEKLYSVTTFFSHFNVTDEPQNSCSSITSGSPKATACLGEVHT